MGFSEADGGIPGNSTKGTGTEAGYAEGMDCTDDVPIRSALPLVPEGSILLMLMCQAIRRLKTAENLTGTAETSSANSMPESGEEGKSESAAKPLLRGGAEINTEASRQEAPGMPAKAKNEMQKQQNRILRNIGGILQPGRYPAGNGIGRDIASLHRRRLSKRRERRDTKRYCCGC